MNDKLQQIDTLLGELNQYRANENYRITEALEIEYTYDSNRIEGNTLTLHETDMVVNKGITIAGKGLREHLEAINHKEAIDFIKDIAQKKEPISERVLLDIHAIVLHSIDKDNAGNTAVCLSLSAAASIFLPSLTCYSPKWTSCFNGTRQTRIPCTRLYWPLRCTRNWCLFIPLLTGMAGQPVC